MDGCMRTARRLRLSDIRGRGCTLETLEDVHNSNEMGLEYHRYEPSVHNIEDYNPVADHIAVSCDFILCRLP